MKVNIQIDIDEHLIREMAKSLDMEFALNEDFVEEKENN